MALCWGVVGDVERLERFIDAISSNLTTVEHKIVAICCPNESRCQELIATYGVEKCYSNIKDLAADGRVEVAYIAVENTRHYEVCLLLLRNGKHILCEAPLCVNQWQTEKILEYAKYQGLFAISGIWSRFFPSYQYLRTMIDSNEVSDIREVYVKHGVKCDSLPRVTQKSSGGGIALDLGAYAIQFVLLCFNEYPQSIKATGKVNSERIDLHFEADFTFSGRRFARIVCSGLETYENQAVIISKKGTVCFPSYCCPLSLIKPDCTIRTWWIPETEKYSNANNSCNYLGLRYEADEVSNCVRSKKIVSEVLTHDEMILIARVQDEIRRQIGVQYDCDKR